MNTQSEYDFSEQIKLLSAKKQESAKKDEEAIRFSSLLMVGLRAKAKDSGVNLKKVMSVFSDSFRGFVPTRYTKAQWSLAKVNLLITSGKNNVDKTRLSSLQYSVEANSKRPELLEEIDMIESISEAELIQSEKELSEWGVVNAGKYADLDELYLEDSEGKTGRDYLMSRI